MDQIYTPPDLANLMVRSILRRPMGVVADFSVGGGELLRAAAARWPKAFLLGADIDAKTIAKLKRRNGSWDLATCNFLSDSSVLRCRTLNSYRRAVGLVLLNPPFSCRGGTRVGLEFEGENVSVSPALAFLLKSLLFLKANGIAVALMPAGSLTSEKDATAWSLVKKHYLVSVVGRNAKDTFHPYVAKTVIVRIERRSHAKTARAAEHQSLSVELDGMCAAIIRGCNQMHSLRDDDAGRYYKLIHTTVMKNGTTYGHVARVRRGNADVHTAAVLIPRVGLPALSKVALHRGGEICLSDCVIAIGVESGANIDHIWSFCQKRWGEISALYGGTGAPYITLERLRAFLKSHGAQVIVGSR